MVVSQLIAISKQKSYRAHVNVTPGETNLVQWYRTLFPVANKFTNSKNAVTMCHIHLPKQMGPIGAYHGVMMTNVQSGNY